MIKIKIEPYRIGRKVAISCDRLDGKSSAEQIYCFVGVSVIYKTLLDLSEKEGKIIKDVMDIDTAQYLLEFTGKETVLIDADAIIRGFFYLQSIYPDIVSVKVGRNE